MASLSVSFFNDPRATLGIRGEHHDLTTMQQGLHLGARLFTEKSVARILLLLLLHQFMELRIEHRSYMFNMDLGA